LSNDGKKHVESNLDSVDENKSVLGGDELEVDGMDYGPDLPGSLAGGKQVVLDFASDGSEGISVAKSKVGEEDRHEDGAPDNLIKGDLHANRLSVRALDRLVKPVVEVVSRRSVVKETKSRKSDETLHVEGSTGDEDLQNKYKGESRVSPLVIERDILLIFSG
jgi:hypothetical protein